MLEEIIETRFFNFENDFVGSLKCIPMIVRFKLDTCRIKLQLADWVKLSFQEKDDLARLACHFPYEVALYSNYVNQLVIKYTGALPSMLSKLDDQWSIAEKVPQEVTAKAVEWECPEIPLTDWQNLDLLERFALVKLSRSGHEGKNFPYAFREFFGNQHLA